MRWRIEAAGRESRTTLALGMAAGAVAAGLLVGWRFVVPEFAYQLLDAGALRDRLGESLWNLHSQPPLLNLGFGLALQVERVTALPVAWLLFALQLGIGGIGAWLFARLLDRLRIGWIGSTAALAFVFAGPTFAFYLLGYFYPVQEAALLLGVGLATSAYLARPGPAALGRLALVAVTLVWLRSLFHPIWAVASLLLPVGLAARARRRRPAAKELAVVAVTLLALAAWPLKNSWRFGFFGMSSWQGLNFAQGLPVERSPFESAFGFPESPTARAEREAAVALVPERFRSIAVLAASTKGSSLPNWNHWAMIGYSRELGARARRLLAAEPTWWARKAARNYFEGFSRLGTVGLDGALARRSGTTGERRWQECFAVSLFGSLPWRLGGLTVPLFSLLFPVAILPAAWRAWRTRRESPVRAGTIGVALLAIGWVLALVTLVDGAEGGRMRLAIDPLIAICAAWGWSPRSVRALAHDEHLPAAPATASHSPTGFGGEDRELAGQIPGDPGHLRG